MSQIKPDVTTIPDADQSRIEEEHAHLEQFVKDLVNTCTEFESMKGCEQCGREQCASCQGRLASFQFDFLDLVAEHLDNEENIMRKYLVSPEDSRYFKSHQAEHVRLLDEIRNNLLRESTRLNRQGRTAEAIRMLHGKLAEIFEDHCKDYDGMLLKRRP